MQIEFEREKFDAPLRIDWIDIALFPQNIGFLILKMGLKEQAPPIDRLNDALYYLRPIHPPAVGWQLAQWRRLTPETPLAFTSRDLIDFLLQGLTEDSENVDHTLADLVGPHSQAGAIQRYSATETGQVYGDVFRQYSYACLAETPAVPAMPEEATPLFASSLQQALYELATCTQTTDPDYRPHPQGLRQTMEQAHIVLWANWEAMALHDSVVFLGARPTPFTLRALAHNIESDYFHLFLLTLYQKMRLSLLSGELMRRSADFDPNLEETYRLMEVFTMFRNHYWFAEVTRKPQGNVLYRRFQQGLGVALLYESTQREVNQLQEYYEQKAQRDIDKTTRQLQREMAENVRVTKKLQESMTQNLETVAKVQLKLEYIEIILVSVYLAELWHLLAPELAHHLPWLEHEWWIMPIKGWGVLFFAVLGAVLTLIDHQTLATSPTPGHYNPLNPCASCWWKTT